MKNRRWYAGLLSLAVIITTTTALSAQKRNDIPTPPSPGQDPTVPSKKMRDKMAESEPATPSNRIPTINLKARIIARGKPPVALVEVDGASCTVTRGTSLSVGGIQVLTFTEVAANEILIELNVPKQTLRLN